MGPDEQSHPSNCSQKCVRPSRILNQELEWPLKKVSDFNPCMYTLQNESNHVTTWSRQRKLVLLTWLPISSDRTR